MACQQKQYTPSSTLTECVQSMELCDQNQHEDIQFCKSHKHDASVTGDKQHAGYMYMQSPPCGCGWRIFKACLHLSLHAYCAWVGGYGHHEIVSAQRGASWRRLKNNAPIAAAGLPLKDQKIGADKEKPGKIIMLPIDATNRCAIF